MLTLQVSHDQMEQVAKNIQEVNGCFKGLEFLRDEGKEKELKRLQSSVNYKKEKCEGGEEERLKELIFEV